MSYYVFDTRLSYPEYLQAKAWISDLEVRIDDAAQRVVGSQGELADAGIKTIERLGDDLVVSLGGIRESLGDINESIHDLNSTFTWGFSELLLQMGRMRDDLQQLVRIARTPEQTWAYEQFDIARDAVRRKLYREALEFCQRAIRGHGTHTGYVLDYRAHMLAGTIRLGSFQNHDSALLDLAEAEAFFLDAARYAAHDHPEEAARALASAGWAAYCQGEMTRALDSTRRALTFNALLAEAHFQAAKILMHEGQVTEARDPTVQAVVLDIGYAVKISADDDFQRHKKATLRWLSEHAQVLRHDGEGKLAAYSGYRKELSAVTVGSHALTEVVTLPLSVLT